MEQEKQNETLRRMLNDAKMKIAGYEQLARVHTAYIAVLIGRLGATKENPITITKDDIAEAIKQEVRGYPEGDAFKLYIE